MKKIVKNITVMLLAVVLLISSSGINVSAKTYSFSGKYTGHNLNSGEKTKIVLKKNKTYKVYIGGSYFAKGKVKKFGKNKYKVPGSYIRMKLYKNKLKVYCKDGRDAKIPYGGTYKKVTKKRR